MNIPHKIETPRLILRQFAHEDWSTMHEHYSDPDCTKYTLGRALSEGESWRTMASLVGHWALRGYGPYAIEEKATGAVLGAAGPWFPGDWPSPEIMWLLIRKHWGKGFASEAVRSIQAMALECIPELSLISFIDARNLPSIQLALSVGATFEKEVEFRGGPWHIYRHPSK